MKSEATDREIRKWVERQFGFSSETGWIAYCRELHGLAVASPDVARASVPCPPEKRPAIKKH